MNQDDALRLFHSNAIILITNLPTFSSNSSTSSTSNSSSSLSLEFGLDFHSWQTGPKFKGVKFIPPGLHLFHYSVINKHGNEGARTSTASSSMGGGGGGGGVVGRSGVFKTFEPGEVQYIV